MDNENGIQLFENKKIRTTWDEENETWYFSQKEKTVLYDLGKAKKGIPHDIEEIMMEGKIGEMARFALR